ncbi:glycosyltransferase [Roseivirga sp. BDSF3-8]|uniref:glycosyltransferase n=1 Tax=Roseivirga sp. BDSF3-8 TaxID=3241598 RepID=UPI0035320DB8
MQDHHPPKVLMIGWEFPPVFTGGLGIACQAIARCLSEEVDLSVIVPLSTEGYEEEGYSLFDTYRNAYTSSEVYKTEAEIVAEKGSWRDLVNKHKVNVALDPYETAEAPVLAPVPAVTETVSENPALSGRGATSRDELFSTKSLYDKDLGHRISEFANRTVALVNEKGLMPDLIYAHDWMTFPAALSLKEATGKRVVLHVHSTDYDRNGGVSYGNFTSQLEKEAFELADHIITVSSYTAHLLETRYGVSPEKMTVAHNGYKFRPEEAKATSSFSEKLVLFLGRITAQKGPEFFFRIISKVAEKNAGVRFVMAGTGDRLKSAIEASAFSEIAHKIHFTGFLNREEVYKLYSMADIYCMPSVSEPFGLTALEAASMGLPCVLSKQSGVAEVLEGALTADYYDVDAYARHILKLLEDEDLYSDVVERQLMATKKLTWEAGCTQIMNVFRTLLTDSE